MLLQSQPSPAAPVDRLAELTSATANSPLDFDSWTALITEVEAQHQRQRSSASAALFRSTFDAFLDLFPLCYGYWKRYADFEFALLAPEPPGPLCGPPGGAAAGSAGRARALTVYERAVAAVGHSVDVWECYLSFYNTTIPPCDPLHPRGGEKAREAEKAVEVGARALSERALTMVGTDPAGGRIWNLRLAFEMQAVAACSADAADSSTGGLSGVGGVGSVGGVGGAGGEGGVDGLHRASKVWDRLLGVPLKTCTDDWARYQTFASNYTVAQLADPLELSALRAEAVAEAMVVASSTTAVSTSETSGQAAAIEPDEGALKSKFLARRAAVHGASLEQWNMRSAFEFKIRRPYFHVQELDEAQVNTT